MRDLNIPSLADLGYDESDVDALVEGAMAQERLLVGSPREVDESALAAIVRESLHA